MQTRGILVAAALCTLGAGDASANVSLKNGNFFVGYTDVAYSGGFEMQIERVYNSKSGFKGIFGWGWGMEYEVYLVPVPDRTVIVHEHGGGAENIFYPPDYGAADIERCVDAIVAAARKAGDVEDERGARDLAARLRSDSRERIDRWEKYLKKGVVSAPEVPDVPLVSRRFSHQTMEPVDGGYQRTFSNGRLERFNRKGQLVRVSDLNANYIAFTYDRRGRMVKMTDDVGRSIALSYTRTGRVRRARTSDGRTVSYRYDDRDALVYNKDAAGNVYRYAYDRSFNLTEISYTDGTSMEITYYRRDKHDSARSVKDRDGTLTVYGYRWSADGLERTVSTEVFGRDARRISASRYDYEFARKPSGETYTARMASVIDGDRTSTSYNRDGLPLRIERGGEVTTFEYDARGNVTRKESPSEIRRLTYDPKVHKVTRVEVESKVSKRRSWSAFAYDDSGNLVSAENSKGQSATLTYDDKGRIATMTDQEGAKISFQYNKASKPVEISAEGVGSITVTYNADGSIDQVKSSGGRRVSLQVTTAFQSLLDVIRPAGVSLSF